jgi:hypothetical protein
MPLLVMSRMMMTRSMINSSALSFSTSEGDVLIENIFRKSDNEMKFLILLRSEVNCVRELFYFLQLFKASIGL